MASYACDRYHVWCTQAVWTKQHFSPGVCDLESMGDPHSLSELSESFVLFALADLWRFLFFSFCSYLCGGLGLRPDKVCIRNAGLGESSSFSSSLDEDSSRISNLLTLLALFLISLTSGLGFLPLFAPVSTFSTTLFSSLKTNCWIRRGSRMFSSGSHVEYLGLHPFHLTRYSVLPFLSLFLVIASAADTWSPSSCSDNPRFCILKQTNNNCIWFRTRVCLILSCV